MTNNSNSIVQDLRLPGQEFDTATGLHHNGFRDYVPGWGRYVQSDPIGLAGGTNTYAFALENPGAFIDRYGLDTLQLGWGGTTSAGLLGGAGLAVEPEHAGTAFRRKQIAARQPRATAGRSCLDYLQWRDPIPGIFEPPDRNGAAVEPYSAD